MRFRLPRRRPDQRTEDELAAAHDARVERFVAEYQATPAPDPEETPDGD